MSDINNVPTGWEMEKLGNFAIHEKGKKPKNISKVRDHVFKIPYVNIKAFEQNVFENFTDGDGSVLCDENDFLMVWDGSRSGFVGKGIKGAVGSTLVRLRFPGILNDYAYYFLQSKYIEINTRAKGTGTPHVDPGLLWNYNFPIPPLEEQYRIVAKIEELFSEIDNNVERLKDLLKQIKIYRQAVLKWAYQGKLTEKWREEKGSLNTTDEVLSEIVIEREKKAKELGKKLRPVTKLSGEETNNLYHLPKGWKWTKSGQFFYFVTSGSRGWAKFYSNSGPLFLRVTNLDYDTLNLDLSENKIKHVSPPNTAEGTRTRVKEGDFLFSITGDLGMFAITPEIKEAYINQHTALCRPVESINRKYLGYWFISRTGGNHYINLMKKGATKAGLTLDDICNINVPLCNLQEQQEIVREIESRLSICDKFEETIEKSVAQGEVLRHSILKQAFEGKLVAQDQNAEPAAELLNRIRLQDNNKK